MRSRDCLVFGKMAKKNKKSKEWSMKKYIALVLVLSAIPLFWLYTDSRIWHTHDGLVHLPRLAAFYTALLEGHFPPRYAGYINFGYGVPLFVYIYHIPYYVGSFFVLLGFSLGHAFRLSITLSYLLSGLFAFCFAYAFFKDKSKALWLSIFYQFAPFRFVELHMRGSYGGVYTYAFLPLTLWALVLFFQKRTYFRFVFSSLSASLLIMSHNSLSLAFYGVIGLFILFFARSIKNVLLGALSLVVGLLLSAWYFVPALLEHKYTYGDLLMKDVFYDHFVPIWHYFALNLFNNEPLQFEGIIAQFGIMHVIAIVLAAVLLVRKQVKRNELLTYSFGLLLLVGTIFFMQPASTWFWENVPFLIQFQFPWRLLSIVVVATSFLSVSYLSFSFTKRQWVRNLILGLTIAMTLYYWIPQYGHDEDNEEYYWNFPFNTTYYGEVDVIWSAGPASEYPPAPVQIVEGYATVENYSKKTHIHTFDTTSTISARLVDNTAYFPGWRVFVDGKKTPVEFQDINWRGLITFEVPPGEHEVRVEFGRTKVRSFSELISSITMMGLMIGGVLFWYRNSYEKRKRQK